MRQCVTNFRHPRKPGDSGRKNTGEIMFEDLEAVARQAIFGAGEIIRENIGQVSASRIHAKGPSDYVTEVDERCEGLILELVGKYFPEHHIMAEETGGDGMLGGYTWVIDPLDGTTNFIHGFPFVAVSIAVCQEKKPILGLVLDPIRNELFSAKKGGGAWLNGTLLPRGRDVDPDKALVATGFPFRAKNYMDDYQQAFKSIFMRVSSIRRAGSAALDLAYLAAGRVDGFWEIGLKTWDVAAGSLIVEEAGGIVSDFWGREDHLENGHIVGGTPSVYPFLLEQVKRWLAPALERG